MRTARPHDVAACARVALALACAAGACDSKSGSLMISISGSDGAPRVITELPRFEARVDARPAREAAPPASFCGSLIEAAVDAVDEHGKVFRRAVDGAYQVPIATHDFSFDTGRSRNVSGHNVSYTFGSDCYPTVTVGAPVLGGLSTVGFWLERRCDFVVDIVDRDCPEVRIGRARGALAIVP